MKFKWMVFPLILFGVLLLLLHSTPTIALRTHILFMGHPAGAITTGIKDDKLRNKEDRKEFITLQGKAYAFTKPPINKTTKGVLLNYLVRKYGFLYFASTMAKHNGSDWETFL
jgi:hypothetical protein